MKTLEEVIESFELMDDWEDRYRLLIDLGKILPPLPAEYYRDEFLVKGCTSKVWMVAEVRDGIFTFQADSDAHIVKGLVALLHIIYSNKPVADLIGIDIDTFFDSLGLGQNLSPNRRNGFFAMVAKIKSYGLGLS